MSWSVKPILLGQVGGEFVPPRRLEEYKPYEIGRAALSRITGEVVSE